MLRLMLTILDIYNFWLFGLLAIDLHLIVLRHCVRESWAMRIDQTELVECIKLIVLSIDREPGSIRNSGEGDGVASVQIRRDVSECFAPLHLHLSQVDLSLSRAISSL